MEPVDPASEKPHSQPEERKSQDESGKGNVTPSSVPQPNPSEPHQNSGRNTEKDWWDKGKRWFEIAGFAALIVYSVYTIRMYYANKEAADAAKSAADTAAHTLKHSQDAFKRQERAYISVVSLNMSSPAFCETPEDRLGTGQHFVCADVHYTNGGRTPAVGVHIYRHATFGPRASREILKMVAPAYTAPHSNLIGTGAAGFATANTTPVGQWTAQQLLAASSRMYSLYVYGVIEYSDVFGDYHETGFCFHRVIHSLAWASCGYGNWLDKRQ
jgi:hypothetical protein